MTIWDFISRTTDSLKRNAPDLKAAKNLFSSVSGNASAAVTKLDDAVRTTFNHYVQEEEAHSKMVRIGKIVAKNATQEALKAIPGASVAYKIVTKSVQDFKNSDKLEVDAKAANMLTLEKEATENSKLHEQAQTNMPGADLKASNIANSHPVVKLKAKM